MTTNDRTDVVGVGGGWGTVRVRPILVVLAGCLLGLTVAAGAAENAKGAIPSETSSDLFTSRAVTTYGSVSVEGRQITYRAVAGTIVVHPKDWDDAASPRVTRNFVGSPTGPAVASMSYFAYFKKSSKPETRPITFLFNGGPGSSTMWLHMGAFGPVRVVTGSDSHTPPAPYRIVNNAYSLLDATDLVFIDAPGTGFSRIEGKAAAKAFYGIDQDAYAFSSFVTQFLTSYGRWNSPRYLLGESYGTPRVAAMANVLEVHRDVALNGLIMVSQCLDSDLSDDQPEINPGVELPYELSLPTYAAIAWYHHKLPSNPPQLVPFLKEVEQFAMGPYADALAMGTALPRARFDAIARKLHDYTGLPLEYLRKADLRVDGLQFEHSLQSAEDLTTGRIDGRFSGPSMDPLSEYADYDPQAAAISSAYISALNDYTRRVLHYPTAEYYRPDDYSEVSDTWDSLHQPDGAPFPLANANLMPDLAAAMNYDPDLKVMVNGGYFDLATEYMEGWYEMHHLPIPQKLQGNIRYDYYASGHMIYVRQASLKELHDNIAAFIRQTDNVRGFRQ
jgi:carboxypeptidase C (cathepsin A)